VVGWRTDNFNFALQRAPAVSFVRQRLKAKHELFDTNSLQR
jgi:hypothetical protein